MSAVPRGSPRERHGERTREPQPREKVEKIPVVPVPHAIVDPRAVVVHLQHALAAHLAVVRELGLWALAAVAPASNPGSSLGAQHLHLLLPRRARVGPGSHEVVEYRVEEHPRGECGQRRTRHAVPCLRQDDGEEEPNHAEDQGHPEEEVDRPGDAQEQVTDQLHDVTTSHEPMMTVHVMDGVGKRARADTGSRAGRGDGLNRRGDRPKTAPRVEGRDGVRSHLPVTPMASCYRRYYRRRGKIRVIGQPYSRSPEGARGGMEHATIPRISFSGWGDLWKITTNALHEGTTAQWR